MKKKKNNVLKITIFALFALVVIYFGVSFYVANKMTTGGSHHIDISPEFIASDYTSVEFKDVHNTLLKGWFFRTNSNKAVILVAGINNNRVNTAYYGAILARELLSHGYNVLMYDNKATGLSEGNIVSFGQYEADGVAAAFDFVKKQQFEPSKIGIIADSMGAVATALAANRISTVGAVVLDSSASDMKPVIAHALSFENNIPALFHPGIYFLLKVLYKIDVDEIKPIATISQFENPILYFHAKGDNSIPYNDSEKLVNASKEGSQLVLFEKGGHIETYKTDPKLYNETLFNYLRSRLK